MYERHLFVIYSFFLQNEISNCFLRFRQIMNLSESHIFKRSKEISIKMDGWHADMFYVDIFKGFFIFNKLIFKQVFPSSKRYSNMTNKMNDMVWLYSVTLNQEIEIDVFNDSWDVFVLIKAWSMLISKT